MKLSAAQLTLVRAWVPQLYTPLWEENTEIHQWSLCPCGLDSNNKFATMKWQHMHSWASMVNSDVKMLHYRTRRRWRPSPRRWTVSSSGLAFQSWLLRPGGDPLIKAVSHRNTNEQILLIVHGSTLHCQFYTNLTTLYAAWSNYAPGWDAGGY